MLKLVFIASLSACALSSTTDEVQQDLGTSPTFQAQGPLASGTLGIFVAWPAEQAGDVGLLVVETANQPVTAPAGWLPVAGSPQGTGTAGSSNATRLSVFWRRAISSSEGAAAIPASGDHAVAQILTFRGCTSSGVPWNATAGDVAATATTLVVTPIVTTTVDNTLVVNLVSNGTDTAAGQLEYATNTALGDVAIRSNSNATAGNGGGVASVTGTLATAGSSHATVGALYASSTQGHLTIALMP